MPVSEILRLPQAAKVERLMLSGQDIKADTIAHLLSTIHHVTICQHDEFAPFDAESIVKQLIEYKSGNKKASIGHVTIYAPVKAEENANNINPCWAELVSHGIKVDHSTMV